MTAAELLQSMREQHRDGVTISIRDMVYHWNNTHPSEEPIRYTPVTECDLP